MSCGAVTLILVGFCIKEFLLFPYAIWHCICVASGCILCTRVRLGQQGCTAVLQLASAVHARCSMLSSQHFSRVSVGIAPAGLAQVDGDLVLLVADHLVRTMHQQILHNLYMPTHCCPVQCCVLPLHACEIFKRPLSILFSLLRIPCPLSASAVTAQPPHAHALLPNAALRFHSARRRLNLKLMEIL